MRAVFQHKPIMRRMRSIVSANTNGAECSGCFLDAWYPTHAISSFCVSGKDFKQISFILGVVVSVEPIDDRYGGCLSHLWATVPRML